jgi:hypothetical protein
MAKKLEKPERASEKFEYTSIQKQEYVLTEEREFAEMSIYTLIAFFLPFVLPQPQLVVGITVNALLVLAALNLKGYRLLPVILLPSLGVLASGFVFGVNNQYLLYMIPFIWAGNALFVYLIKEAHLAKKMNRWLVLGGAAISKSALLFGAAFALVSISAVPAIFLTSMGIFQLYTAIGGGVAGFALHEMKRKLVA